MASEKRLFLVVCFFLQSGQVFASFVNVALKMPTYQSSNYDLYQSSTGVDGTTIQSGYNFIHTALKQNYTWWEVDLRRIHFVHYVTIYFRTDYKFRRNGVKIYSSVVCNQSNSGHRCDTVTGNKNGSDIPDVMNITCNSNARCITVYLDVDNGDSTVLDFLEVEVYVCGNGSYGSECANSCDNRHCVNITSTCDPQTGECDEGCEPGWEGGDCLIVSELFSRTSLIAGSVSGTVVFTIVILIILILLIWRKTSKNTDENIKKSSDGTTTKRDFKGTNVYANAAFAIPEMNEVMDETTQESTNTNLAFEEVDEQEIEEENQGSVYCNVSDFNLPEEGVVISDLSGIIENIRKQPGGFETEFKKLPNEFTSSFDESQIPENKPKNRFKGYYPYDWNRVLLSVLPDEPHSDYINASYIDSYSEKNYFIAAQAPNQITLQDFWRMIWEKDCRCIVMLTKLVEATKKKCEPYWSDERKMTFGNFIVEVTEKKERRDYVYRKVFVKHTKSGKSKLFQQFHFIMWPDHGVPVIPDFIEFMWQVRKTKRTLSGPVLVHCSAGVGRTGTYIALEILLDEMETTGRVDVFKALTNLRDQRKGLIQTKEQYEMIFITLLQLLNFGNTCKEQLEFQHDYPEQRDCLIMGKKTIQQLAEEIAAANVILYEGQNCKIQIDGQQKFFAKCSPSFFSKCGYLLIPHRKRTEESLWKLVTAYNSKIIITLDSNRVMKSIPAINHSVTYGSNTITTLHQKSVTNDIREITLQVQGKSDSKKKQIVLLDISERLEFFITEVWMKSLLTVLEKMQIEDTRKFPITVSYRESETKRATMLCIGINILTGLLFNSEIEIFHNINRFQAIFPDVKFQKEDFSSFCKLALTNPEVLSVYANCPSQTY